MYGHEKLVRVALTLKVTPFLSLVTAVIAGYSLPFWEFSTYICQVDFEVYIKAITPHENS